MHRPANQTEQDVRPRDVGGETAGTYLELDPDGTLTAYCGKVELGTGLATAMAQIVADALGVPVERVRMVMGDTALTADQGTTAGSKSVQLAGPVLRAAAIAAREELMERASGRLEVDPVDLIVEGGVVRPVDRSSAGIPIGELATGPFTRPVGEPQATVSDPRSGVSTPRIDLVGKLTGAPAFVHDVTLPGMLHGRVVRPLVRTPAGAGRIDALDDREARAMPGVVAVVREGDFLGVVAEREEQAARAAEALARGVTWAEASPLPSLDAFQRGMRDAVVETREVAATGDADVALARADRVLRATYTFPFVAHASLGPSCAVADVRDDRATVWCSAQGPYALQRSLAPLLGLPEGAVRVVHREGAGCYGHNGADDVAADAALLSRAAGRPVRVQWSRQQEFAWEPKSPAMVIEMAAGLDVDGGIVAWTHDTWTPTHVTRPNGQADKLLAGQELGTALTPVRYGGGDRNAPVNYALPESRTTVHWVGASPLRPSALRSLGGTHNTAANEWFLDEIAHATGADPVALRLGHLGDPRAVAVLEAVATRAGWGEPLGPVAGMRTGRGVAFVRYELEYTYVATVAEVAVDPASGEVRVTRVVVAHDCGRIVNPDGVLNQVEGNVIQGVSRALKERVGWDEGAVTSLTWAEYPILTFPETPAIEVELIDRPEAPSLGAGEAAICTVPAAIGNAIFAATGARLRDLPFTPDRVRAAMGSAPS
jgi:CO/xanthine dehydrogenase Mo-binding subunit